MQVRHDRKAAAARVSGFSESVFARYTALARQHGAVNLGQGFPDFAPPGFVTEALREACEGDQQYAPVAGLPELLQAIADEFGAATGLECDPVGNVQVSVGATEALFLATHALVDPGDEVILFTPYYDSYPANVAMAGGTVVPVPLEPGPEGWAFDPAVLERAFCDRTKLIVVNTPHNPVGKVFAAEELDLIVELASKHDALILSDEVYEHIAWRQHLSIATRPGAWERTLTVSSIGKTYSVTGWKIGWLIGPAELIRPVRAAHQWLTFAVATPLQRAAAACMRRARRNNYHAELLDDYTRKRDLLTDQLIGTSLKPLSPDGSYFLLADASAAGFGDATELCLRLPELAGVAMIPVGEFQPDEHRGATRHLVRLAFCKSEAGLREAGERLRAALPAG